MSRTPCARALRVTNPPQLPHHGFSDSSMMCLRHSTQPYNPTMLERRCGAHAETSSYWLGSSAPSWRLLRRVVLHKQMWIKGTSMSNHVQDRACTRPLQNPPSQPRIRNLPLDPPSSRPPLAHLDVVQSETSSAMSRRLLERGACVQRGEVEFRGEVVLQKQAYWWHDKYRPRKPKYFNRVHTGCAALGQVVMTTRTGRPRHVHCNPT